LAAAVRRLRHGRVEADYAPTIEVTERLARSSVRDAALVLSILEIEV
jgi:hypothetical protein